MSETQIEAPKKAPVKRRKKRATAANPVAAVPARTKSEFAGITTRKCCNACTAERCVISTVATCKHPYLTSDSGCGPITMANREAAKKHVKHEMIDAA